MLKKIFFYLPIIFALSAFGAAKIGYNEPDLHVSYKVDNSWDAGAQLTITIENNTKSVVNDWQVEFDLNRGQKLDSIWNGIEKIDGQHIAVKNPDWGSIAPGKKFNIGFILSGKAPFSINNLGANNLSLSASIASSSTKSSSSSSLKENRAASEKKEGKEEAKPKDEPIKEKGKLEEEKKEEQGLKAVASKQKKIIGYYTAWSIYDISKPAFRAGNFARDIPANLLTHINYAFLNLDAHGNLLHHDIDADTGKTWHSDSSAIGKGNIGQLKDLKKVNPNLRLLISIGGWTLSNPFSAMAENQIARKNFAKNAVNFCKQWGFDGFDIDWEFPGLVEHGGRPIDKANFTLLLKDCYEAAKSNGLLLTIAAPAGIDNIANIEIDKIHKYVDWINLMSYDFHGPWKGPQDLITNHNAPLNPTAIGDPKYNVKFAVDTYLKKGVPPEKLVVGVPFYGRSYANANTTETGLFSDYSSAGTGTFDEERGMRLYADIRDNLMTKSQWNYYFDSISLVPYLYNKISKEFISFDDAKSIAAKSEYVKSQNLGGVMIWEIRQNVTDLLNVINKILK